MSLIPSLRVALTTLAAAALSAGCAGGDIAGDYAATASRATSAACAAAPGGPPSGVTATVRARAGDTGHDWVFTAPGGATCTLRTSNCGDFHCAEPESAASCAGVIGPSGMSLQSGSFVDWRPGAPGLALRWSAPGASACVVTDTWSFSAQ